MEQHANTAAPIESQGVVVAANSNIISFPRKHDGEPRTPAEAQAILIATRTEFCEQIADEQFEAVIAIARDYGVHTRAERIHEEDYFFLREMILAVSLRYFDIPHDFQRIPDETIRFSNANECEEELDEEAERAGLTDLIEDLKE